MKIDFNPNDPRIHLERWVAAMELQLMEYNFQIARAIWRGDRATESFYRRRYVQLERDVLFEIDPAY